MAHPWLYEKPWQARTQEAESKSYLIAMYIFIVDLLLFHAPAAGPSSRFIPEKAGGLPIQAVEPCMRAFILLWMYTFTIAPCLLVPIAATFPDHHGCNLCTGTRISKVDASRYCREPEVIASTQLHQGTDKHITWASSKACFSTRGYKG